MTRKARVTYSGSGYGAGYAQGQRADIGRPGCAPDQAARSAAPSHRPQAGRLG